MRLYVAHYNGPQGQELSHDLFKLDGQIYVVLYVHNEKNSDRYMSQIKSFPDIEAALTWMGDREVLAMFG